MSSRPRPFYPTVARLPAWATAGLRLALVNLRVARVGVRLLSRLDERDLPRFRSGLMRSPLYPQLTEALDSSEVEDEVRREAPVDGREVVEWMQIAAAINAVLSARAEEYNTAGSQMVWRSGDGYVPGVEVEDVRFRSIRGREVSDRGYAEADTPRGRFRVNAGSRANGIFQDLLTWGAVPWVGIMQWIGVLLKWRELANTPIENPIGFPVARGIAGPQYVVMRSSRPALRVNIEQVIRTTPQRLYIYWRDPNDYRRTLAWDFIDFEEPGEYSLQYRVISFPYVPPTVIHMEPEIRARTVLMRFTTSP